MPILTNSLERFIFVKSALGPGPILDLMGALSFRAVYISIKLGIFNSLAKKPHTLVELSSEINVDIDGLQYLLRSLISCGYIKKKKEMYINSRITRKWLQADSKIDLSAMFSQFDDMLRRWDYMPETINNGNPPINGMEWLNSGPGRWDKYQSGLKIAAEIIFKDLSRLIKFPLGAGLLLDLGGGHGQYSIEFCKRDESLRAIIVDFEESRKTAEKNIVDSNMIHRIEFISRDFLHDDIGSGYDAVLISNIIRILSENELHNLIQKVHSVLNRSGMIIIIDHLGHRIRSRFIQTCNDLIKLELFNSIHARFYNSSHVTGLLSDAGFTNIKSRSIRRSPGLGIITAQLP